MKVFWHLAGGECAGEYHAESDWPPPQKIRAVYGGGLLGDGPPAVLDLPDDEPDPGEKVVEYELESHGFICARGRAAANLSGPYALYLRAGLVGPARMKALRRGLDPDLSLVQGGREI